MTENTLDQKTPKTSAPEALADEALDSVTGGALKIPTTKLAQGTMKPGTHGHMTFDEMDGF